MNNYFNYSIIILLVLVLCNYISDLSSDYPDIIHDLVDEPLYKFIVLLVIFYISTQNYQIGLLLGIIFLILINNIPLLSEYETNDKFINGPSVANCNTYNPQQINTTGTVYYPLQDNNNTMNSRSGVDSTNPPYDNNF